MKTYLRQMGRSFFWALALSGFIFTSAVLAAPNADDDIAFESSLTTKVDDYDPFESINRVMFGWNRLLDKCFLRPAAVSYDFVLPTIAQQGVRNVFLNLSDIAAIANNLLQLRGRDAMSSTFRLVINTTVGVGGLFDVATKLGLERQNQDFGLTLARWGIKNTPYIVMPIWGASNVADIAGVFVDYKYFSIWTHIYPFGDRYKLLGVDLLAYRSELLRGDKIVDTAYDPYVLVRNAYWQRRAYLLNNQ